MWSEIIQLIGLLLISATKFLFAPLAFLSAGYGFWPTVLFNAFGGFTGAVIFYFLGQRLFAFTDKLFSHKRPKRRFNRQNRLLVVVKKKFGLWGLAALIPLISVPISAMLAAKYFRYDSRVFLAYGFFAAFWSLLLTQFSKPLSTLIQSLF